MESTPVNWDDVKAFYLETRSYKAVCERFGIPIGSVKSRAHREGWSDGMQSDANPGMHGMQSDEPMHTENGSGYAIPEPSHTQEPDEQPSGMHTDANPSMHSMQSDEPMHTTETGSADSIPSASFFCLPNLSTGCVKPGEPWAFRNGTMPQGMTKDEFRTWSADAKTQHLFYSAFEGANAALRVTETNPATLMHGLVVDYDAQVSPEERAAFMSRASVAYPPSYICTTFSGGVRLVWLFEGPLLLFTRRVTVEFLSRIKKELKLKKLFPGIDDEALARPSQYYHCGLDWEVLPTKPLSLDLLYSWVISVSQKAEWGEFGDEIPTARVAEEVEKRFPGRWSGPFEIGARGSRFWDDTASNPTAAIVRSSGMQCFTGTKAFVSWGEILGRKFVNEFRAETTGAAIKDTWFDGRDYWRNEEGLWRAFKKPDIAMHFRVAHGISDERRRGVAATPMDQLLHQIQRTKAVDGAAPFIYRKDTRVNFCGKQYLNIARSILLPAADGPQPWGVCFPYIAELLDGYFDSQEQLPFFLSWLAYGYHQAVKGKPSNGQVVFLAGDVNQGKTLVSNVLVGDLFGGHMDASDYLLGESKFNKELFEVGLWTVDDTVPSSDPRRQQLYSAMLKKIPANYAFQYHPKFRDPIMLPWAGRVLITCNADPESIRILPDVEMSLLDKVMLFKIATVERDFMDAAARIRAELPFLARFLLDYKIPDQCRGDARFGVKCYHHADLLEEARQSGRTAGFAELLEIFQRSFFSNNAVLEWEGNATELKQAMLSDDAIRPLIEPYSVDNLGRLLGKLASQSPPFHGLSRPPKRHASRVWRLTHPGVRPESCPF